VGGTKAQGWESNMGGRDAQGRLFFRGLDRSPSIWAVGESSSYNGVGLESRMTVLVLEAMAREGFEEVVALVDRETGLRGFLGLHDTSRGPGFGGVRRFAYRDEAAALADCLRLSKAMSYKCALADIEGGGAKLVVLDRPDLDLERAYRQIGRWIERLGGRYYAGPDVGTGEAEIRWMASQTEFVAPPGDDGPGDLAGATATGVFAGMTAALRLLDGAEDWARRTVVIQGLGRVGLKVAERLRGLEVRVLATDVDTDRLDRAQEELGIEPLEAGSEFGVSCDIFSPCAMGGILHDVTISRLDTRVVCGASNNPLARSVHGQRLHEREVLYVPDYVVNAGAVMRGAEYHLKGRATPLEEIEVRIGTLAADVLREAAEENLPPVEVAEREAVRRLEESRRQRVARRQRTTPSEVHESR